MIRLSILATLLLTGSASWGQGLDPAFGPFVPYGQLEVRLDDRVLDDAEMFHAERQGSYLLRSTELGEPLLINVRSQQLERLNVGAIRDNANGTVSLLAGAVVATVGPFQVEGSGLTAALDGNTLTLGPKPHLLGPQTSRAIETHDVSYRYRAGLYPPSDKIIAALKQETRKVTVKVYFGSWCSACARYLPWLMQVERALEGSSISFEYHGLPHTMDDPVALEAGVKLVPTAVVSADGNELGRRNSSGLGIPEEALLEILGGD